MHMHKKACGSETCFHELPLSNLIDSVSGLGANNSGGIPHADPMFILEIQCHSLCDITLPSSRLHKTIGSMD